MGISTVWKRFCLLNKYIIFTVEAYFLINIFACLPQKAIKKNKWIMGLISNFHFFKKLTLDQPWPSGWCLKFLAFLFARIVPLDCTCITVAFLCSCIAISGHPKCQQRWIYFWSMTRLKERAEYQNSRKIPNFIL